jgi:hypothetical protein
VARARSASTDGERRAWLAAAAALALAYALFVGRGGGYPIPLALLTVALVLGGLVVLTRHAPRVAWPRDLKRLLAYGLAVQLALLFVWPLTNPLALPSPTDYLPFWLGMAVVAAIAVTPLFGVSSSARWRLVALIIVHFAIGVWVIGEAKDPFIDVWIMQRDGAEALMDGVNPYLPIYPNIHGPDSPYYGPGLVVDGELTIGFPYPPLSLLLVLPGQVLGGDPRFAHLVAIELGALAMAFTRAGSLSIGAALLYMFTPWTFFMVAGSWTEPLVILMVALVALVAVRAPRLLGVALGLLIGVKQYLLLGLPLALMLLAADWKTRWRLAWQSIAIATAITVPFLIWDIGAFSWSTLGSLAGQAFRPDSLTYLTLLPGDWGPRLSVLGFLLLIPGIVLVASRAPRGASGFAASLGFLLLVFFAFSRQGSANYHFAVIGALCCAVATSQWQMRDEPVALIVT